MLATLGEFLAQRRWGGAPTIGSNAAYACVVFCGAGACAMVVCYMQAHAPYAALPTVVTASFLTVGMAGWVLMFSVYALVFAIVRRAVAQRRCEDSQGPANGYEEELVRLMDAIDTKKHDADTGGGADTAAPAGEEAPARQGGARVLQIRRELAVSIYMVASGVFFSAFALTGLERRALECFAGGLLTLAVHEFWLRRRARPVCRDAAADVTRVHHVQQLLEGGLIVLLAMQLVLLAVVGGQAPGPTAAGWARWVPLAWGASAAAPFCLWAAPAHHHHLVTLESAIPGSTLLAVFALFMMSPVESYVRHARNIPHSWLLFVGVSMVLPVALIGVLHLLQQRLSVLVAFALLFWATIHALVQHEIPAGYVVGAAALALGGVGALAGWRAHAFRFVQDHAVAAPVPVSACKGDAPPSGVLRAEA